MTHRSEEKSGASKLSLSDNGKSTDTRLTGKKDLSRPNLFFRLDHSRSHFHHNRYAVTFFIRPSPNAFPEPQLELLSRYIPSISLPLTANFPQKQLLTTHHHEAENAQQALTPDVKIRRPSNHHPSPDQPPTDLHYLPPSDEQNTRFGHSVDT